MVQCFSKSSRFSVSHKPVWFIKVLSVVVPSKNFHSCLMWLSQVQKQPPELFHRKGVLRNFTKFTGKHRRQSLFSVNFAKFLRTPFLQNTSGRLLLQVNIYWNFLVFFCNKWSIFLHSYSVCYETIIRTIIFKNVNKETSVQ